MTREEFENLKNLPGKVISGDIRLTQLRDISSLLAAEKIRIENSQGVDARMTIDYNLETDAKSINVHIPGTGPICRLEVDSRAHRPYGRNHKHSLLTELCPSENLKKGIVDFNQLSGRTLQQVFQEFCRLANIQHNGQIILPQTE